MTPILQGRYLVALEKYKVRRARAGHPLVEWRLRIVRNLTDAADAALLVQTLGRPAEPGTVVRLEPQGNRPGELVEAVTTSNNRRYLDSVNEAFAACDAKLVGSIPDPAMEDHDQHDELLRLALEPLVGKVAVVDAASVRVGGWRGTFTAVSWSRPTPADLCSTVSLPEALALIAKVYRTLKDGQQEVRPQVKIDRVLELLDMLEVPR